MEFVLVILVWKSDLSLACLKQAQIHFCVNLDIMMRTLYVKMHLKIRKNLMKSVKIIKIVNYPMRNQGVAHADLIHQARHFAEHSKEMMNF